MNGIEIQPTKVCKYLGAHFHYKSSGTHHIKYNIGRFRKALNIIKTLAKDPWANSPKSIVQVTNSLVRSRLTYGLEAYWDLTPTLVGLMESVECQALKLSMGLSRATPNRLVYRDSGLLHIKHHIKLTCAKYIYRAQSVENSTDGDLT